MKKIFSLFVALTAVFSLSAEKVYFVNTQGWQTVKIHLWGGSADGTAWPGVDMQLVNEQIQGFDVYEYSADAGSYTNCIFNNGSGTQTADLVWTAGKYFVDGAWYAKEDIPVLVPAKYYITGDSALMVDAGLEKGKAWNPSAIKSEKDTFVLNLKANQDYLLKLTINGTWNGENNVKGYNELSEKTEGLKGVDDGNGGLNVGFTLKEAGEVKVVYVAAAGETPEVFKLIGNFYVEQTPEPTLPYVALIGEMNNWDGGVNQLIPANDGKTAAVTVNLAMNANNGYSFKILVGPIGLSAKGNEGSYVIHREWTSVKLDWVAENSDALWLSMDIAGDYTFTYTYADSTLAVTFPAKPEPKLKDGYYLMGVIGGVATTWNFESLKAEHLFARNEGATEVEEYTLNVTLAKDDELQVVGVTNDAIGPWFPGGDNGEWNYKVAADMKAIIYFRPNKDGSDDWWHKCIYVAADEETAIGNVDANEKAQKMIVNGQLLIIKAGKTYNILGAVVE